MGELLLVITILTLVVLTIRRAKPVVLDSPVIIQRAGKYHITLAPQLNRAQTFLESIASQFAQLHTTHADLPTLYFEVRDPKVFAKGEHAYLLAVALRGGMLYFQAINPQPLLRDADSHLKTVREFSEAVLAQHPDHSAADAGAAIDILAAVGSAAQQLNIAVLPLQENNG